MQISRRDRHVRVPRRVSRLSQRPPAGQSMRYKSMPPVMDRQSLQPLTAEYLARRAEPTAYRVPRQARSWASVPERADEEPVSRGALANAFVLPAPEVGQRAGVPPERDHAGSAAF